MYEIFRTSRSEEQWYQEHGRLLFAWGILNPNGPTLSCVGLRQTGAAGQIEVYYRWLHFLGGETYVLGYVDAASTDLGGEAIEVLRYAFSQEPGRALRRFPIVTCVPHFITLPADKLAQIVAPKDARDLIVSSRAFQEADWGAQSYYLTKYGADFIGRAGAETREALERLSRDPSLDAGQREYLDLTRALRQNVPGFQDWQPDSYRPRPLEDGDIEQWWSTISDPDFTADAIRDLAFMWVGAIHQASRGTLETVEDFETLKRFLESQQCAWFPESYSSHSIAAAMNLG